MRSPNLQKCVSHLCGRWNSISVLWFILFVFGNICSNVEAQSPLSFGSCAKHPTVKDFDPVKFTGEWFEVERSFYLYELMGSCPKFNFTVTPDNNFEVKFYMKNRVTGNDNFIEGIAYTEKFEPGRWTVRMNKNLPTYISRMMPGSGTYRILDTDYDHYAILWSCSSFGLMHADQTWILGRQKTLKVDKRLSLYSVLESLNIDDQRLVLSNQSC